MQITRWRHEKWLSNTSSKISLRSTVNYRETLLLNLKYSCWRLPNLPFQDHFCSLWRKGKSKYFFPYSLLFKCSIILAIFPGTWRKLSSHLVLISCTYTLLFVLIFHLLYLKQVCILLCFCIFKFLSAYLLFWQDFFDSRLLQSTCCFLYIQFSRLLHVTKLSNYVFFYSVLLLTQFYVALSFTLYFILRKYFTIYPTVSSQEGWCTADLYLAQPCVKSCTVWIMCPLHRPLHAQSTSSLS
jgi:hypothetical protein